MYTRLVMPSAYPILSGNGYGGNSNCQIRGFGRILTANCICNQGQSQDRSVRQGKASPIPAFHSAANCGQYCLPAGVRLPIQPSPHEGLARSCSPTPFHGLTPSFGEISSLTRWEKIPTAPGKVAADGTVDQANSLQAQDDGRSEISVLVGQRGPLGGYGKSCKEQGSQRNAAKRKR